MSSHADRERFIQDIPTVDNAVVARPPFRVETDNRRRFIRIEISTPMSLDRVKAMLGDIPSIADTPPIQGRILNISGGGVLVDLDQMVEEGDLVLMSFTLQDVEQLQDVAGLVKRVDHDDEGVLAGIEFLTTERLVDVLSQAELDLLGDRITSFDEGVRDVLNRYIVRREAAAEE